MSILIVDRDPDGPNDYTFFGMDEPKVVTIDYGASEPTGEDFAEWRDSILAEVEGEPEDVRAHVESVLASYDPDD